MDILKYIPGFRTKKVWKMIIASLYYLLAFITISQGFSGFLMLLTLPFIFFGFVDVIKNGKHFGKAIKEKCEERKILNVSIMKFVGYLIIFIIAVSTLPPSNNTSTASKAGSGTPQVAVQNTNTPKPSTTPATSDTNSPAPTVSVQTVEQKNTPQPSVPTGSMKVHYIDVGQADSILIQSPGNKVMLIDAGNNSDGTSVVSYLKSQGVNRIDVLIGTHPHEDHIGGMDNVVNSFDIGSIYMPRASSTSKTFEDLLNAIKGKGLKVTTAVGGISIDFDSGVKTDILAPNGTSYDDLNNYSSVIKMTFGNTSYLFTGDAENISEQEMLSKGYNLQADVLKVGHHGSSYSTTSAFLKSVSPKYAVISVGKGNSYGHPSAETINRLNASNIQIYRTDEAGTIIITSDGKSISIDKKASTTKENAPPVKDTSSSSVKNSPTSPPVASGQSQQAQKRTVYYTPNGKSYHFSKGCSTLSRSKTILEGTLDEAINSGHADPCDRCTH